MELLKLKEIGKQLFDTIEDNMDSRDHIIIDVIEKIDIWLEQEYEIIEDVENSLRNDYDYCVLENDEEKEEYIENNKHDRLLDILCEKDYRKLIYEEICMRFNRIGYDCYEGEFFPNEGVFTTLNGTSVVFVKRTYNLKISTNELFELVDTEMNESCHSDNIEDYENELEFCLSNVKLDCYTSHYLSDEFEDLSSEDLTDIQDAAIKEITERLK